MEKDRLHQAQVENIFTIIASGHHAHSDTDTGFTGFIPIKKCRGAIQIVIGKIAGKLLRIRDVGGDLDGKIRVISPRENLISKFVEDLRDFRSVALRDAKDNGSPNFTADRAF